MRIIASTTFSSCAALERMTVFSVPREGSPLAFLGACAITTILGKSALAGPNRKTVECRRRNFKLCDRRV